MRQKELLVFDFDGTIVDSKALYYNLIYDELKQYGFSYNDVSAFIELGLNLSRTLEKFGLPFLKRVVLGRRIMRNVKKNLDKVSKCKDVDSIRQMRMFKIVISNSSKKMIFPILKHYRLKRCFKKIYGAEDFKDKARFIKKCLKKWGIQNKNCFYVGDRIADVNVARAVGCKSIIVCGRCAWDSPKELLLAEPDFIVGSIKEIKKIV